MKRVTDYRITAIHVRHHCLIVTNNDKNHAFAKMYKTCLFFNATSMFQRVEGVRIYVKEHASLVFPHSVLCI